MSPPKIILLHGWTMRGAVFDDLIARLDGFEVMAPDLPGHGTRVDEAPTLANAAALVARLVDENPTVLIGWSMGAMVAWEYVARYGTAQLAGLITVDMSPKLIPNGTWQNGLIGQSETRVVETTRRVEVDWPGTAKAIAATMFAASSEPLPFGRKEALAQILSCDADAMRGFWDDLLAADHRETVAHITCPWLVTTGALSRVYGRDAAMWLAKTAPNAELLTFEASGHSPHLEEPEAFAAAVRAFVGKL